MNSEPLFRMMVLTMQDHLQIKQFFFHADFLYLSKTRTQLGPSRKC